MDERHDEYFGLLRWNAEDGEWQGSIILAPHEAVRVALPPEYLESPEIQQHIRQTMAQIKRDEHSFRERSARQIFADDAQGLYLYEDEPAILDVFVANMHLGMIDFEVDFDEILLWYEYDAGREHGILITLAWDGSYVRGR
jgi:hypothetical protein